MNRRTFFAAVAAAMAAAVVAPAVVAPAVEAEQPRDLVRRIVAEYRGMEVVDEDGNIFARNADRDFSYDVRLIVQGPTCEGFVARRLTAEEIIDPQQLEAFTRKLCRAGQSWQKAAWFRRRA